MNTASKMTTGDREGAAPQQPIDAYRESVLPFQVASASKATWQLINSAGPYLLLWTAMVYALQVSYWLMLPLAVVAAGFLVRIFIIFHDCGHGSFLPSRRANQIVGGLTGLVNLTPYQHWRWQHALHHGTSGNLDRRGAGDVWTLTVQEYLHSNPWKRAAYRVVRHPLVLFAVAPLYVFIVHQRFPSPRASARERRSVRRTNWTLLCAGLLISGLIGWKNFLLIQLTVSAIAGALGLWLFYVQHQFEGGCWSRSGQWDYTAAALRGSSFYKLPKILQWFTGNIGFHHIHHLSPRIANYHLEKCHLAEPDFRAVGAITLLSSLKALGYRMWDEQQQVFVGFSHLKRATATPGAVPAATG